MLHIHELKTVADCMVTWKGIVYIWLNGQGPQTKMNARNFLKDCGYTLKEADQYINLLTIYHGDTEGKPIL